MSLLAVVPRVQCALNDIRPAAMAFDDVDLAIHRRGRRRAEPKGGPQPASGRQPRGEFEIPVDIGLARLDAPRDVSERDPSLIIGCGARPEHELQPLIDRYGAW